MHLEQCPVLGVCKRSPSPAWFPELSLRRHPPPWQMGPWFPSPVMPCIGSQEEEEEEGGLCVLALSHVPCPRRGSDSTACRQIHVTAGLMGFL